MKVLSSQDYHTGWICAHHIEFAASRAMLDEKHEQIQGIDLHDHNQYVVGGIRDHNVVMACLPAGVDGTNAAAVVVKDMIRTFTALKYIVLVGIGGGIPDGIDDIRLGDVVVSQPEGMRAGVIQYDKGKAHIDGFQIKGTLNMPSSALLTAVNRLRSQHEIENSNIPIFLSETTERHPKMRKMGYIHPGAGHDVLFDETYHHSLGLDCSRCDRSRIKQRKQRDQDDPVIHYGTIASGNTVVKDPTLRKRLYSNYNAICVEREAAGLMNAFPCLVICGICDYADSHKNDIWHRYAATTAAAYAKELLTCISADQTRHEKPIQRLLGAYVPVQYDVPHYDKVILPSSSLEHVSALTSTEADTLSDHAQDTRQYRRQQEMREQSEQYRRCDQAVKTSTYMEFRDVTMIASKAHANGS